MLIKTVKIEHTFGCTIISNKFEKKNECNGESNELNIPIISHDEDVIL
jgi:hypothetical protein